MNHMSTRIPLAAAALALAAFVQAAPAADYKAGTIEIDHPFTVVPPRGASVAAGYMTLVNTGSAPDRLVSASAQAARKVDIHEMTMTDGVMKMRPIQNGVEVKPGQTVELKSGSYHLMLTGLKQPLKLGDKIKGTLTFEKAGQVDIEYTVEGMRGAAPGGAGTKMDHMH
jgi:hypothetical protein